MTCTLVLVLGTLDWVIFILFARIMISINLPRPRVQWWLLFLLNIIIIIIIIVGIILVIVVVSPNTSSWWSLMLYIHFYNPFFYHSDRNRGLPPIHVNDLATLNEVEEITGYLAIQTTHLTNLSFLSNLRRIRGVELVRWDIISILASPGENFKLQQMVCF